MLPPAARFIPNILDANASIIIVSIGIGITIGVTEELLWRGVYVRLFPDNIWLKYIYPLIEFGLWHLASQSVLTMNVPGEVYSFMFSSTLLGFSWGYYVHKTNNIRWCTAFHVINDTLDLAGFTWLPMLLSFMYVRNVKTKEQNHARSGELKHKKA